MLKHETKLIDPTPEQVVAALTEAAAAANKRCRARLLADKPATWRKFARDSAAAPEGYAMFRGGKGGIPATQVLAAWWTDAIGRKHVVLRGRRVEHDEARRLLRKEDLEQRPALWHAYPEYVCRRTAGKESQIVCACGCGAVGTPQALGWMGETCGPCFDRKEEVGAGALGANLPGVLYGDRAPLGALACSPDGTRVAAVEGDNCVTCWDIPARTRTMMKFNGARVTDVAITSDGARLVVVGLNLTVIGDAPGGGLFAAFDLTADPLGRLDPAGAAHPAGWRVAALADPTLVLRHLVEWPSFAGRLQVVRVPGGEVVRDLMPAGTGGRFALSADGTRLATCGGEMVLYDVTGDRPRVLARSTESVNPRQVAFGQSHRLFAAFPGIVREYDGRTAVAQGRINGMYATALAADPAGQWVCAGDHTGRLYVLAANGLAPLAVFEWHLGPIACLATSADGSRLFSSCGDGCVKVWPIRELLRGI